VAEMSTAGFLRGFTQTTERLMSFRAQRQAEQERLGLEKKLLDLRLKTMEAQQQKEQLQAQSLSQLFRQALEPSAAHTTPFPQGFQAAPGAAQGPVSVQESGFAPELAGQEKAIRQYLKGKR